MLSVVARKKKKKLHFTGTHSCLVGRQAGVAKSSDFSGKAVYKILPVNFKNI